MRKIPADHGIVAWSMDPVVATVYVFAYLWCVARCSHLRATRNDDHEHSYRAINGRHELDFWTEFRSSV
jgi:hypothetical protein